MIQDCLICEKTRTKKNRRFSAGAAVWSQFFSSKIHVIPHYFKVLKHISLRNSAKATAPFIFKLGGLLCLNDQTI